MIPYWLLFAIPAFAVLFERAAAGPVPAGRRRVDRWHRHPPRRSSGPRQALRGRVDRGLIVAMGIIAFMIGLRYQVGGDWGSYLWYFYTTRLLSFAEVFAQPDPGYILLNWLAVQAGGDIWLVNLLCGLIFACGLFAFVRAQPRPWLALLVAIPYLVIVVAMGYSRQAVAIGFAMLGLVALSRGAPIWWFILWVALAASVHKTAVLLIPIAALSIRRGWVWTTIWLVLAGFAIYVAFLEDSVDTLWENYVIAEYQSQGAAVRVAMNALPAAAFLLLRKRFVLTPTERALWINMALIAVALVVFLMLSPSSTAVDRMALYWIPLQLFVLSRLPDTSSTNAQIRQILTIGIVVYSAAIQFVWLNFAVHADAWVPYQFYFMS